MSALAAALVMYAVVTSPVISAPLESKTRIAFVGDSMADGLWEGTRAVSARSACLTSTLELGRLARNSTGLTRPDKYNWPEEVRRIAKSFKPNLFVVSLGLNDRQSVIDYPEGGKRRITMPEAAEWADRYRERVTAMLKGASVAQASVLWVGLPISRDAATNRDAALKNKLFAQAVEELAVASVQYVPPWRLGTGEVDVFATHAPDRRGRLVQIRTPDGTHFTPAGYELVGIYLWPSIVANLAKSGIELDRACPTAAQ